MSLSLDEYQATDAIGLAERAKKRDVAPSEVVECALTFASTYKPTLNVIIHSMEEEAWASLATLPDGPLKGVPFVIKDLATHRRGQPTGTQQAVQWIRRTSRQSHHAALSWGWPCKSRKDEHPRNGDVLHH